MRVLIQRVSQAEVSVEGTIVGKINQGLVLLTGFNHDDQQETIEKMAEKIVKMRIFVDKEGKMNLAAAEVNAEILAISQFTLYADTQKGRRPSFVQAAKPEYAAPLMIHFIDCLKAQCPKVESGRFGADMQVQLINDGPFTLMVES